MSRLSFQTFDQYSILPTFYDQLFHQNPFAKKIQIQSVITEKLSYMQKAARKKLLKLTPQ
jgi:hypothetical protein